MKENNLIGWLCFLRLNLSDGETVDMPVSVQDELIARGWIEIGDEKEWDGASGAHVTDKGAMVSDLNAPEWGIDVITEGASDG